MQKLNGAAIAAAILLSSMVAANAATITLTEGITITSATDGPIIFDFGAVSAGVANTFGGSIQIANNNPFHTALTIPPPINGFLNTCPPSLSSGSTCIETINFFFSEFTTTAPGIYSGQQTQNFTFADATGAIVTDPVVIKWTVNVGGVPVPGPTVGAGASSFALAALFLGWLVRRRGHMAV